MIAEGAWLGVEGTTERSNTGSNIEIAKPLVFNKEVEKIGGFIIACKLYLRIRIRRAMVEEQIQWILSYVQGGSVDVWKENVLEDLEMREAEFESAGELLELKKEFGRRDEESVRVAGLRRLE